MIRAAIAYMLDFIGATLNIFLLLIFVLFLPWLFLWYMHIQEHTELMRPNSESFKLGIEMVSDDFLKSLTPSKDLSYAVGLVTNQTSIDQKGKKTVDILLKKGLNIKTIFSPQHQGQPLSSAKIDGKPIPIINLDEKKGTKNLNKKNIEPLDVIIVDIQDVGVRHYGYAVKLLEIMSAAARHNKTIVVLDRPNLLGCYIEGAFCPIEQTNNLSPIPLRHGMTIGELASFFNSFILTKPSKLHIVPMQKYNRMIAQENLTLTRLSANINSMNSCYGYSFLGIIGEITPFDVGIGTDKAFQCLMVPDKLGFPYEKWKELSKELEQLGIESRFFRYLSRRKQQYFSGLRLSINDSNKFRTLKTLLTISTFFKQAGITFAFSPEFDKIIGTTTLREMLTQSDLQENLVQELNRNTLQFFKKACTIFLYKPFPQPVMM